MKIPINKIAHGIGMQNQYLGNAVYDGKVIGELEPGGDYHSDKSWVDLESVREYIKWRYDNMIISKVHLEKANQFLDSITGGDKIKYGS